MIDQQEKAAIEVIRYRATLSQQVWDASPEGPEWSSDRFNFILADYLQRARFTETAAQLAKTQEIEVKTCPARESASSLSFASLQKLYHTALSCSPSRPRSMAVHIQQRILQAGCLYAVGQAIAEGDLACSSMPAVFKVQS